jgi:5'-deoxynucleotidase YfbR-like HD superfamily hydrolase
MLNWPKGDGSIQSQLHRCDMRYKLAVYLLRHDEAEAIESDIPGPIKRLARYDRDAVLAVVKDRFGDKPECTFEMKQIRVTADLLDECMYLAGELNAGNQAVKSAFENSRRRLMASIDSLPGDAQQRASIAATLTGVVLREVTQTKNLEGLLT